MVPYLSLCTLYGVWGDGSGKNLKFIDPKMQSEYSGPRPDTSSLVHTFISFFVNCVYWLYALWVWVINLKSVFKRGFLVKYSFEIWNIVDNYRYKMICFDFSKNFFYNEINSLE